MRQAKRFIVRCAASVNRFGFYVTGTDTGVGKTVASVALLHALRARGLRVTGMKPVASGCEHTADGWRNEDALALWQAGDPAARYAHVNPYALPEATAPELAAREAHVDIELQTIVDAYRELSERTDAIVVEGVGGWAAPLSAALDQRDLVRALQIPVVMVVGLRLGCINHARLTVAALVGDGVQLAGWICNDVDPALAQADAYFELLRTRVAAPCLGRLPFASDLDPATLSAALDCTPLFES